VIAVDDGPVQEVTQHLRIGNIAKVTAYSVSIFQFITNGSTFLNWFISAASVVIGDWR
jgi:hypothetical protein